MVKPFVFVLKLLEDRRGDFGFRCKVSEQIEDGTENLILSFENASSFPIECVHVVGFALFHLTNDKR